MGDYKGEIQVLQKTMAGMRYQVNSIYEADKIFKAFVEHNNLIQYGFKASKTKDGPYVLCVFTDEGEQFDNIVRKMYGVAVGDRVCHVKEPSLTGVVTHIDLNLIDITTCLVRWDGDDDATDIQWTNKLLNESGYY